MVLSCTLAWTYANNFQFYHNTTILKPCNMEDRHIREVIKSYLWVPIRHILNNAARGSPSVTGKWRMDAVMKAIGRKINNHPSPLLGILLAIPKEMSLAGRHQWRKDLQLCIHLPQSIDRTNKHLDSTQMLKHSKKRCMLFSYKLKGAVPMSRYSWSNDLNRFCSRYNSREEFHPFVL